MNKKELIAKIASEAGITKTQATAALDSLIANVSKTLIGGGKVRFVGVGTFIPAKAVKYGVKKAAKKAATKSSGRKIPGSTAYRPPKRFGNRGSTGASGGDTDHTGPRKK